MGAEVTPIRPAQDSVRLLTPYDVKALTGLGYEGALALTRVYGFKKGNRYYITMPWLEDALEQMRRAKAHD